MWGSFGGRPSACLGKLPSLVGGAALLLRFGIGTDVFGGAKSLRIHFSSQ